MKRTEAKKILLLPKAEALKRILVLAEKTEKYNEFIKLKKCEDII